MIPPDKQPPGKWVLTVKETGGTATGKDFGEFVKALNDMLRANGFPILSAETILERMAVK